MILLPYPGICLRPGVYRINSPVYPRRVIETGVYSKPACIHENTVIVFDTMQKGVVSDATIATSLIKKTFMVMPVVL